MIDDRRCMTTDWVRHHMKLDDAEIERITGCKPCGDARGNQRAAAAQAWADDHGVTIGGPAMVTQADAIGAIICDAHLLDWHHPGGDEGRRAWRSSSK